MEGVPLPGPGPRPQAPARRRRARPGAAPRARGPALAPDKRVCDEINLPNPKVKSITY